MKVNDLLDAIGEIDDSYLDVSSEKTKHKKTDWKQYSSI